MDTFFDSNASDLSVHSKHANKSVIMDKEMEEDAAESKNAINADTEREYIPIVARQQRLISNWRSKQSSRTRDFQERVDLFRIHVAHYDGHAWESIIHDLDDGKTDFSDSSTGNNMLMRGKRQVRVVDVALPVDIPASLSIIGRLVEVVSTRHYNIDVRFLDLRHRVFYPSIGTYSHTSWTL